MSQGYLKVIAVGTLGADAETRYGQSGNAVCSWRMACTTGYYDAKAKERKEITEWVSCVIFGKRAETLGPMLVKGKEVFIEGTLKTDSYDKNGEKRYRTQVVVNEVILGGRGGGGNRGGEEGGPPPARGGSSGSGRGKPAAPPADDFGYDKGDGGIPF